MHSTSITVTNWFKTSSTKAVACCVIYSYTMVEDKMQLDPFGSFLDIYLLAGTNIWDITQETLEFVIWPMIPTLNCLKFTYQK